MFLDLHTHTETSCQPVNFSGPFNVIKNQICALPTKEVTTSPSVPPKFTSEPSNQTVLSDTDYVTFECGITSSYDAHLNILWKHDDKEVTNSEEFNITQNATSSYLRVKVGVSTVGVYRCIAINQQMDYSITSRYGNLQVDSKSNCITLCDIFCASNFQHYNLRAILC